jgi:LacI family transcriptional regulator
LGEILKVTITDIANIADVSVATVSRVINNKRKGVSEETRERILKIIEDYNFKPSAVARGLVTKSSNIIGLIIPDITNPFYPTLAKGAEDAASERGYNTILFDGGNIPEKEATHLRFLNEHYVSGIIYNNFREISPSSLEIIKKSLLPTVFIDSKVELPKSKNIYIDNKMAMKNVINYLYDQGHRDIAFLGGPIDSYSSIKRYEGYIEALNDLHIPLNKDLVIDGEFIIEAAGTAVEKLMNRGLKFTAIACCNDILAIGVYAKFEELGISIPDDISVVGFDDILMARLLRPKLTTVQQPAYEMGKASANVLIDCIEGKSDSNEIKIIFDTDLMIRDSVKKLI